MKNLLEIVSLELFSIFSICPPIAYNLNYCNIRIGLEDAVSCAFYIKLNEKIEKTTQWIYIILMKICLPLPFVAALVGSMLEYYVFGLGTESFNLPFPLWYAFLSQSQVFKLFHSSQSTLTNCCSDCHFEGCRSIGKRHPVSYALFYTN